jgi:CRISPR-associated endoribonuclease Cas6
MEKKTPENLYFHFMSPVCINYKSSEVTEMFPHREAVFKSLENSWNQNAPEEMQFEIDTEKLKKHVIEKAYSHDTANTVVTRKKDGENRRQIKAFGFTGKTEYGFKNAPEQLKKKLAILTRYAKHAGLGSHTARGLGNTYTEVRY